MLIYCGSRILDIGIDRIQAPLVANMLMSLSMWDVELAETFFTEGVKFLYKPNGLLIDFAKQRGWDTLTERNDSTFWHHGVVDSFDGVESHHASWHSINGGEKKIEKLIWSAQVAILLPKIEMHRHKLAPIICEKVKFPYNEDGYIFQDVNDVEIGSLAYFASNPRMITPGRIPEFAKKLRNLRNDLAHMRILEEHRATDLELLSSFDPRKR